MIEIIDNFLPQEEFKTIQDNVLSNNFVWNYCDGRAYPEDGSYLLHQLVYQTVWYQDPFLVKPILDKLNCFSPIKIKYNMTMKESTTPTPDQFHVDFDNHDNFITSILYINTNNGYTEFEDGTKVDSIANRLVKFPCNIQHRSCSSTDVRRIVLNINYLENKD